MLPRGHAACILQTQMAGYRVEPPTRARLPGSFVADAARHIASRMSHSRTLGLAAETAFWLFLALLPLAAVAGMVAARVAVNASSLTSSALQTIPPGARSLVMEQLDRVAAWNGGTVAPMAAVVFLWLASTGVQAIFDVIEVEVGAARPWWKKRLIAMGTCIALSVGIALLAILGTGLDWLLRLAGSTFQDAARAIETSFVLTVARLGLGALVAFGLVAGLYRVGVPGTCSKKLPIAPGALVAVVLQSLLGFAYSTYVGKMGNAGAYLAGLAAIGVALTALLLMVLSLLIGLQINLFLLERRQAAPVGRNRKMQRDARTPSQAPA
jgi:membrane protein